MEENRGNLDTEFKRYLQILRPYVGSLVEKEAIQICNEWIRRLNSCNEEEKPVRNKYIFVLCYQLAKGILSEPFIKHPTSGFLPNISEVTDSDTSLDLEFEVLDEDDDTKVLYENLRDGEEEEYHLTNKNYDDKGSKNGGDDSKEICLPHMGPIDDTEEKYSEVIHKHSGFYFYRPETAKSFVAEVEHTEMYESRANNLILRLRNLKKQNMLLHNELAALKEQLKDGKNKTCLLTVDNCTCTYERVESSTSLNTLKSQIRTLSNEKQCLLNTLESMQAQLDEFEDKKNREFEELIAQYKIQLGKLRSTLRDEYKNIFEKKIVDLKEHYENTITVMEKNEMQNALKIKNEFITDIDKLKKEKSRELLEKDCEIQAKNKELFEKDNIINEKKLEITHLKFQLDEQASKLQSMVSTFLTQTDKLPSKNMKVKAEELEKRLSKMEKSKAKCIKAYEIKLSALQREKHLTECSLQLQLVKQRAQIVNELADENQTDLAAALDKLEAKYKDIVANVQSTAIRRTVQDEKAINAILEAACACGLRSEVFRNQTSFPEQTVISAKEDENPDLNNEIFGVVFPNGRLSRSFVDDHGEGGFCLNGERLGELFEKVYVPMRDDWVNK